MLGIWNTTLKHLVPALVATVGLGLREPAAQSVLRTFPNGPFDPIDVIGDVDADGTNDVAIQGWSTGIVSVYSVRSGLLLQQLVAVPPYIGIGQMWHVGDLDGDAHADFLYATSSMVGPSSFFHVQARSSSSGAVLYTSAPVPSAYDWTRRAAGLGDVNNDGRAEFLVGDLTATVNGLADAGRVDLIDGATRTVIRSHLGFAVGQRIGEAKAIGDHDGDGIEDYVVRNPWGELWGYSGATGVQLFYRALGGTSFGETMAKVGDFNADGRDDFAVSDRGSYPFNSYRRVHVLGGPNAAILWQRSYNIPGPIPPDMISPTDWIGDLDRDGYDDLLGGWNVVSGRDHALPANSRQLIESLGGASPYGSILGSPGDANDDGWPDLLAASPATNWTLQLLSGAPPGATSLGNDCVGTTGEAPAIGVSIGARLGRTLSINLADASPQAGAAILGFGYSDQQWGGVPLPLDLAGLGLPGCQWFVAANTLELVPLGGLAGLPRHATRDFTVPNAQPLLGLSAYFQWLVLSYGPGGTITGATTRYARTTVVP